MLDDRALASRCAGRDPAAWRELLERFDRRVLRVLLRAGVPEADAGDLRQEVYARLLAQDGAALRALRAEREGALGAFLAQIALRVAIDHGRSRGTRAKAEVPEEEAHRLAHAQAGPDDAAALDQGRGRFAKALLSAAQGPQVARDLTVLRAHFVDGLNPLELADMGFGLSAKGVETLVRRARLRIEGELSMAAPGLREDVSGEVKEK